METGKIKVHICGNIDTKAIADLTAHFSKYRINILDLSMFHSSKEKSELDIICQSSSTTDEIDSFWNELDSLVDYLNLRYSKKYL
jgi:hypothetical protein